MLAFSLDRTYAAWGVQMFSLGCVFFFFSKHVCTLVSVSWLVTCLGCNSASLPKSAGIGSCFSSQCIGGITHGVQQGRTVAIATYSIPSDCVWFHHLVQRNVCWIIVEFIVLHHWGWVSEPHRGLLCWDFIFYFLSGFFPHRNLFVSEWVLSCWSADGSFGPFETLKPEPSTLNIRSVTCWKKPHTRPLAIPLSLSSLPKQKSFNGIWHFEIINSDVF